jgi:uncharacterized protein YecE (DUF72 family)
LRAEKKARYWRMRRAGAHCFRGGCVDTIGRRLAHMMSGPRIFLGTSAFTAAGWAGTFYPAGMKAAEYLSFYAEHFDTVEIDSTYYATPAASTVLGWAARTPAHFIFSVKVPQIITHEKVLQGCEAEWDEFVRTMDLLGEKLGPIVLQFPFFDRCVFRDGEAFLGRLGAFLERLPADHRFAVEIRNKEWLDARLAELLRERHVALVLQDQSWMPHPQELESRFDPITADWTYIRWLGDRKGIELTTKVWNRTVVDRRMHLRSWVAYCERVRHRGTTIFAYANNHYAGHAPATIALFIELWREAGLPEISRPRPARGGDTLFEL